MAYGPLGPTGDQADMAGRLRTAMMRRQAMQRSGPGGGGGYRRSERKSPSERMTERHLRKAMQVRAEKQMDANRVQQAEAHKMKMEMMRSEMDAKSQAGDLNKRRLELEEQMGPEKLAMLREQFEGQQSLAGRGQDLAQRMADYKTGPGHDLRSRELDIREMGNMKPTDESMRFESVMQALAVMQDPNAPIEMRQAAASFVRGTNARGGTQYDVPEVTGPYVSPQDLTKVLSESMGEIANVLQSDPTGGELRKWAQAKLPNATPKQILAAIKVALKPDEIMTEGAGFPMSDAREQFGESYYPKPSFTAGFGETIDWKEKMAGMEGMLMAAFERALRKEK